MTGRRTHWLRVFGGALLLCVAAACTAPAEQADCERRGGTWGTFGLAAVALCKLPTADAGTACSGHHECESLCIAERDVPRDTRARGECYGHTVTLGTCLNRVRNGVVEGVVCED